MAGLVAQTLTTPLDVVRTRIMVDVTGLNTGVAAAAEDRTPSTSTARVTSPVEVLGTILREEGVSALGRGMTPRAVRAIASGAIQFASYELTQNYMKHS
eukprot:gene2412-4682_t